MRTLDMCGSSASCKHSAFQLEQLLFRKLSTACTLVHVAQAQVLMSRPSRADISIGEYDMVKCKPQ